MRRKITNKLLSAIFFSILIILMTYSSLAIVDENNKEIIKLNYSFDTLSIYSIELENSIFDKLSLPNCYTAGNPGEPNIPSKGAYILLPPMSKITNIQIEIKNKENLGFGYNVEPIGEAIPISDVKVIPTLVKNDYIYGLNDFYPGELFSYVGVYSFRGYDILVILLHPIQYNPVTGELIFYKDIDVTVETSSDGEYNLFRNLDIDKIEVMKKVENPEIAELYSQRINHVPTINEDYDLLILTTDSLKYGFEPLKNAHNSKGTTTVIKTLTDVGSSNPEDIRDYIIDAYSNWGINYVLLGGDHDIVPAKILWVYGLDEETTPYETYLPSDLYYSCLNGPYNYDGDDKWGEPTDGADGEDVDLIADVYVGRACVDNIDDVNNFVSKTVAYINKDPELEYLKNACFSGEYMGDYGIATWGGNYMDQLIDACSDDGYTTTGFPSENYTFTYLYDRDWEGNDWPKEEMINVINEGVHFINHLGHSYYEYNMKMYNDNVYDFTNTDYCFIYSQGCMAGGFDEADCIAEYFTVKTDTGAFAGIWNARYGWFWSYSTDGDSQRFHREFWDAVFGENIPQIGKANADSKEDNLAIINRSCIRWVYYEANLFGDPSLCFYEIEENDPPETPDIDGPSRHKVGVEYNYSFVSTDPDGDELEYYIDWGDGNFTNWLGPYGSGDELILSHTFTEKGNYTIRSKVRDIPIGAESDWGEFTVKWQSKSITNVLSNLFERLLNYYPRLLYLLGI
ncbi:hypothetical protein AYK24_04405 [Thermoplasmatales archaeon SG8-52-4]|nr:MAG: hypothetical protein AYK24_04405 [Thermoplasmatales archaeon SG8-52-4]